MAGSAAHPGCGPAFLLRVRISSRRCWEDEVLRGRGEGVMWWEGDEALESGTGVLPARQRAPCGDRGARGASCLAPPARPRLPTPPTAGQQEQTRTSSRAQSLDVSRRRPVALHGGRAARRTAGWRTSSARHADFCSWGRCKRSVAQTEARRTHGGDAMPSLPTRWSSCSLASCVEEPSSRAQRKEDGTPCVRCAMQGAAILSTAADARGGRAASGARKRRHRQVEQHGAR
jgi:hypothetical protein